MLIKLTNFFKQNIFLFLILILAIILRVVLFEEVPPSLNWDEISHGYNAYSILKTGKDEWGNFMPIIFRAYGDYKLPVYIYTTVVSIALFGLNAFAVRLPSLIGGIFTVLFTYLLARELLSRNEKLQSGHPEFISVSASKVGTGERRIPDQVRHDGAETIALFATLLVAISPWTFFLSRGAFEANLALTFLVSGMYFFIRGLEKPKSLIVSSILLGLSVWTYNSFRVFIPLLIVFLFFLYRKELFSIFNNSKKTFTFFLLPFALFLLPMFYQLLVPVGQARYEKVAILEPGAVYQIEEARNNSTLSPFMNRMANNRVTYFTTHSLKNWVSHYSPNFLFLNGGTQYQFSVPGEGLLYVITSPFLLLGLFLLIKRHDKLSLLLLFWFLVGSIASSITREAPHVLRSITMLPSPMIITAIGIVCAAEWIKSKKFLHATYSILLAIFIFALLLSMERYMLHYFNEYKTNYSWSWQYGYEEVVSYAKEQYIEYDNIIVTKKYGEPHEFFLFYNTWDPGAYRNDPNLIRYAQSDWFWVDRFDKYWFVNDWQIKGMEDQKAFITESKRIINCAGVRCLLITTPSNAPSGWRKINTVNFLDDKPAFELYEN